MGKEDFNLQLKDGLRFYSCRMLDAMPWLGHGFSTRIENLKDDLGKLVGQSDYTGTRKDGERERDLVSAIGFGPAKLVTLRQIHSDTIHIIEDFAAQWDYETEGDVLITGQNGIALGIRYADCFPILVADPKGKSVATIHAGWRGTLQKILFKAILCMKSKFRADPGHLVAAIGPGIGKCCFEVGSEVWQMFMSEYGIAEHEPWYRQIEGKYFIDLIKLLEMQLISAGIRSEHISSLGACTKCNMHEFFSFRGEGLKAGRMIAIIGRKQGFGLIRTSGEHSAGS